MIRKNKRRLAALCMAASLLSVSMPQAMALSETTASPTMAVMPRMEYIYKSHCTLSISGGKASVAASITGLSGLVTKCKVSVELQEKNGLGWTTIDTWTSETNGYRLSINEFKAVTTGKSYRAIAVVTAWSGSASESKTITSSTSKA